MSQGKKHPDELQQQAINLLKSGLSIAEVGRRLGLPRGTVSGWRRRAGFDPLQIGSYDLALKEQVRALYLDGIGHHALAARFGVSLSAVGAWVRDLPGQRQRRNQAPRKFSKSDVRFVLGRLEDGESIASVAADLRISPEMIRRWAADDLAARRAKMREIPANERYQISDPARALALSGAWR